MQQRIKNEQLRVGEFAQLLGIYIALTEDSSLILST